MEFSTENITKTSQQFIIRMLISNLIIRGTYRKIVKAGHNLVIWPVGKGKVHLSLNHFVPIYLNGMSMLFGIYNFYYNMGREMSS